MVFIAVVSMIIFTYRCLQKTEFEMRPGGREEWPIKIDARQTEEGTFMVNIKRELLNSKTEWHQPKIVRTTIHTGGAELAGGRIVSFPVDGSQRTQENRPHPTSTP